MRRKYPWEQWFGHPRITLMRGVHYHCSQSTMAQTVRNNASNRGLHVRLTDIGVGITVEITEGRGGASTHTDQTPVAG